jgi:hypothetical protein
MSTFTRSIAMRAARFLLFVVAAAACGGQVVDRSNGTGGRTPSVGTGGVVVHVTPAATGGDVGTGGDFGPSGDFGTGGTVELGGSPNVGGYDGCESVIGGNIGYGSLPEPLWSVLTVEEVCIGNLSPPAVAKWIDDFEGGTNVFDPTLVLGWANRSDVEETVCGVARMPLDACGSHDPSSKRGLHMRGLVSSLPASGKDSWGADWEYATDPTARDGGQRAVLDLSAYAGIVLWARLVGAPGKGNMVVALPTPETTIAELGGDGSCGGDSGTVAACGADYQAPAKITKTCWTSFQIPFANLKVPYGNMPAGGFDKAHVFGVELLFNALGTAMKANWPIDVIVDDVYLYSEPHDE